MAFAQWYALFELAVGLGVILFLILYKPGGPT